MNAVANPLLTIWYDASCPLCATEMHALVRHGGATRLQLKDCSAAEFDERETVAAGFSRADLMRCIHARDENGNWLRGVDVFVRAYRVAGLETVARVWSNRWLRPLWDRTYPWVARHRVGLSKLQLHHVFGWMIACAAHQSSRRANACHANHCDDVACTKKS